MALGNGFVLGTKGTASREARRLADWLTRHNADDYPADSWSTESDEALRRAILNRWGREAIRRLSADRALAAAISAVAGCKVTIVPGDD